LIIKKGFLNGEVSVRCSTKEEKELLFNSLAKVGINLKDEHKKILEQIDPSVSYKFGDMFRVDNNKLLLTTEKKCMILKEIIIQEED